MSRNESIIFVSEILEKYTKFAVLILKENKI